MMATRLLHEPANCVDHTDEPESVSRVSADSRSFAAHSAAVESHLRSSLRRLSYSLHSNHSVVCLGRVWKAMELANVTVRLMGSMSVSAPLYASPRCWCRSVADSKRDWALPQSRTADWILGNSCRETFS